ncbi:L,D-transpeptidase [Aquibium sp. A9E412]|uniref:L,D-transpeptidase n=1 Tax=Aquibium sp. A9E412 TaxID=2976767 RepID=UPI0025AF9354|nr:L,D-transpeptidase [Aquibium sp. A9E412]MDN2567887.1 L,D-transpeptidase [Aquibium sp. A9E412]
MRRILLACAGLALALAPAAGQGRDRYVEPPPVVVSPDLSAPWVLQLSRAPAGAARTAASRVAPGVRVGVAPDPVYRQRVLRQRAAPPAARAAAPVRTAAVAAGAGRQAAAGLDPRFLPQVVDYAGPHAAGTLVVDTRQRFLYHVLPGGKARRYGVGVGKPGFEWAGTHKVSQKREWPDWRPPAAMIAREKKKGNILPAHMKGGPANPLGARALYLGSTLYRIHGTNAPWTIGQAVSSGCIRMRNEDVIELYNTVPVGAKVVVI